MTQNPFITAFQNRSWGTFDESIPFQKLQLEHFMPALDIGIEEAKKNIQKIKQDPHPANFENTFLALESCSELHDVVSNVYFNLFSAEASPAFQALAKEIAPKNAAFASEIMLDADLFKRIKAVYDQLPSLKLTTEQKMMVEKVYRNFVRNGALLNSEQKEVLKKLDQELSTLSPLFSEHVLKATNSFEMWVQNKEELDGLPEGSIEAAALDAEKKGQKGKWLFTLQAPSYIPFMQYAKNRELRKKLWLAFNSRAFHGENSNQDVILKTVRLRHQRAQLLGYKTHADITLTERMAESPEKVIAFQERMLAASHKAAIKDLDEVREFKKSLGDTTTLEPWDFSFYSEKLKEKKYAFNEEELRPYFQLENVVQGIFDHAKKLYGLTFKKNNDLQTYHPDANAYEVHDEKNEFVGLFYTDFFPRETKKDGAWMTNYREQGLFMGQIRRPHVSIVCNFTKPTPTKPSLLTYDEVLTMFHEFGHALHGLLSKCQYRSLSGANVYWDFVELPSQIMENWVKEKEGLDVFARHYQTGEKIPSALVDKIKKANLFQAGYYCLRQLNFGFLDMKWHMANPDTIKDVSQFELQATEKTRTFPYIEGTNSSCAFSHIFAGGYSAGYYSYKWAEVLDADAFEFFKEKGIFNQDVAKSFQENILSKGGTEHPMELYKKFRGREPDPNALLRRDGLV